MALGEGVKDLEGKLVASLQPSARTSMTGGAGSGSESVSARGGGSPAIFPQRSYLDAARLFAGSSGGSSRAGSEKARAELLTTPFQRLALLRPLGSSGPANPCNPLQDHPSGSGSRRSMTPTTSALIRAPVSIPERLVLDLASEPSSSASATLDPEQQLSPNWIHDKLLSPDRYGPASLDCEPCHRKAPEASCMSDIPVGTP